MQPIDFNGLDTAVHGPIRLGVLTALETDGPLDFTTLKKRLDVADGAMGIHLRKQQAKRDERQTQGEPVRAGISIRREVCQANEHEERPHHDGRRAADKKLGYIHPCSAYPLSDLEIETPGEA